jgi:hypothetical protein
MEINLKKVLMQRDGMSGVQADQEIKELRSRVFNGENPEEILFNEYRLEPDYIWDLI